MQLGVVQYWVVTQLLFSWGQTCHFSISALPSTLGEQVYICIFQPRAVMYQKTKKLQE